MSELAHDRPRPPGTGRPAHAQPSPYWKYRETDKAYAAILAEAGHLSQTQYLVAAELGLGSYVTPAVNAKDIERRLGIDGANEGVVAMTGCGPRTRGFSPLELEFAPIP
jgi:nitroreductase